jgi:hypothetical protein
MKARVGVLNILLVVTTVYIASEILTSFDDDRQYCLSIYNPAVYVMENFTDVISDAFGIGIGEFYTQCINSCIFSMGILSFIAVNMYDSRLITLGAL